MNNESDMKRGVSSVKRHYNPSILKETDPHEGMDEIALRELVTTLRKRLAEVESELYELKDRLWKAERRLEDLGYRHCDIPACNCNSYHRWSDPPEVATLRADNERLSGEVESLNDLLKTHKVIENFKSFEKCAKELEAHKAALENARCELAEKEKQWAKIFTDLKSNHESNLQSFKAAFDIVWKYRGKRLPVGIEVLKVARSTINELLQKGSK